MKQEKISHSAEETRRLGNDFASHVEGGSVLALSGDLGAGKTTLTQGLLEGLGAEGPYTSPTFVIMKQYEVSGAASRKVRRIYHVDAYRVGSKEILALGWEEWIDDPEGLVIVEWPERVAGILPEKYARVSIEHVDETSRKISIET